MKKWLLLIIVSFLIGNAEIGNFVFSADNGIGVIRGKVFFNGNPPDLPQILTDKNIDFCGKTVTDPVLVVQNQGIQGAVVSLDWKGEIPIKNEPKSVSLQSRHCLFQPRIQATQVGAFLALNSGDEIAHNPHGWWNDTRTVFNITLLNPNLKFKRKLKRDGIYRVECDTHTWMKAYILVFKHPFYAVTDAQGDFLLKNIPAGRYTLRVWHEVLGEQTSVVVVAPEKETHADFMLPLVDQRPAELKPKTVSPWPPNKSISKKL